MTPKERRETILKLLEQHEFCTVEYLTQCFNVSLMTVRRDLAFLESEKRILRLHTGASLLKFSTFAVREHYNVDEKKKIASFALEKMKGCKAIYLNASSTALVFAKQITPEHGVTVVTNSLRITDELTHKHVPVYCTGGQFYASEHAFYGEYAEKILAMFHFNAAFISPNGAVSGDGVYDSTEHGMRFNKLALQCAERAYIMCTASKFGKRFRYQICSAADSCEYITEDGCFPDLPTHHT